MWLPSLAGSVRCSIGLLGSRCPHESTLEAAVEADRGGARGGLPLSGGIRQVSDDLHKRLSAFVQRSRARASPPTRCLSTRLAIERRSVSLALTAHDERCGGLTGSLLLCLPAGSPWASQQHPRTTSWTPPSMVRPASFCRLWPRHRRPHRSHSRSNRRSMPSCHASSSSSSPRARPPQASRSPRPQREPSCSRSLSNLSTDEDSRPSQRRRLDVPDPEPAGRANVLQNRTGEPAHLWLELHLALVSLAQPSAPSDDRTDD